MCSSSRQSILSLLSEHGVRMMGDVLDHVPVLIHTGLKILWHCTKTPTGDALFTAGSDLMIGVVISFFGINHLQNAHKNMQSEKSSSGFVCHQCLRLILLWFDVRKCFSYQKYVCGLNCAPTYYQTGRNQSKKKQSSISPLTVASNNHNALLSPDMFEPKVQISLSFLLILMQTLSNLQLKHVHLFSGR